jgi:hypothetical protein
MDNGEIDRWLNKQENQEDEPDTWFSSINENDLIEPAKKILEENYLQGIDDITWYVEPNIQVRERHPTEPPTKLIEQPDLLCRSHSAYYVIELKKKVGKKAIGQSLNYYWALRHGEEIKHGGSSYELIEDPTIVSMVAGIRWQQPYYRDFFEWIQDNMCLEDGGLSKFGISRSQID